MACSSQSVRVNNVWVNCEINQELPYLCYKLIVQHKYNRHTFKSFRYQHKYGSTVDSIKCEVSLHNVCTWITSTEISKSSWTDVQRGQ